MKMVMRSKEEDCDKLNLYSRTKWEICEMISDQVELEAIQARRTRMGIIDDQVDAMWTATDPRNQQVEFPGQEERFLRRLVEFGENTTPPMRMFDREGVELRHPPYDPIDFGMMSDNFNSELRRRPEIPPYDLTPEYVGLARSTRGTVFNVDE